MTRMQRPPKGGHLIPKLERGLAGALHPKTPGAVRIHSRRTTRSSRGYTMRIKLRVPSIWALAALASSIAFGTSVAARAQDQANPPSSTAPDNSAQNQAHRKTAENQKENSSDREITQKIRQSIVSDKSLSTYGHNVK